MHRTAKRILIISFTVLWLGGLLSYSLLGGPPQGSEWTAPLFLALAGAIVLVYSDRRDLKWVAAAALIGFCSELVGTAIGVPFGQYEYTATLGPQLLGVPLVLCTAWLVLVAYVQHWMRAVQAPALVRPFLAASWMTVIDLVIDPLAAGPLEYWVWAEGGSYFGIPWTNFLGWFIVSLVIFAVVPRRWHPPVALRILGASVIAFFGLIAFALGYFIPGLIAFGLIALDAAALLVARTRETRLQARRV